ncbi:pyridoxamine 5'-phosphate oxidase family protein [Nocardia sp. NPDC004123]
MGVIIEGAEREQFLQQNHTAVLTTLRADGRPISLPIWYVELDGDLYIQTPRGSAKLARIRRDPRASLLIERGKNWTDLAAIHLDVSVMVVEDQAAIDTIVALFDTKYAAHQLPLEQAPPAVARAYADQVVLRLRPLGEGLSWDNSKIRLIGKATVHVSTTNTEGDPEDMEPTSDAAMNSDDLAEIQKVVDHLANAYYNRDIDAAVSTDIYHHEPDSEPFVLFDWTPPMQLAGLDVFRDRALQFFEASDGPVLTEWADTHISILGDVAYFRGIWNIRFRMKGNPKELAVSMRETLILRRIQGKFKIVHEHNSIPAQDFVY